MEAELRKKTESLANEIATQATTLDELNGLLRTPDEMGAHHFDV